MTETRCEPPEHLRGKPGYHWLRRADTEDRTPPVIWTWRTPEMVWRSSGIERQPDEMHHHYVAHVPNHDVVARLVETLEAIASPDQLLDANEDAFAKPAARRMQAQATAALAAYREAGR